MIVYPGLAPHQLEALALLSEESAELGAIIGKAWYEGRIDLAEAISVARASRP